MDGEKIDVEECKTDKPQNEYSSIRGKLVYVSPTEEQYELLSKRLKELLSEGRGETIIEVCLS